MGSKLVRRGVLFTVLAIIIVFAVVFIANADRFRGKRPAPSGSSAESTAEAEEADPRGLQIGDNLKAFLADPDFFDPVSLPSSVIEEEEVITVSPRYTVDGHLVTIHMLDGADRLITGQAFAVRALQAEETVHRAEMIYTDSDMDGIIRVEELPGGEWDFAMRPILGFRIPTEEIRISIEKEALPEEEEEEEEDDAASETEETQDGNEDGATQEENATENAGDGTEESAAVTVGEQTEQTEEATQAEDSDGTN
ncbi:MAG: hypothetical protein IK016_01305 [Lachnospiraceae bacterium]|nr:hypothetical protein [Lachnospiraceae bacterium]